MNEPSNYAAKAPKNQPGDQDINSMNLQIEVLKKLYESLCIENKAKSGRIASLTKENDLLREAFGKLNKSLLRIYKKCGMNPLIIDPLTGNLAPITDDLARMGADIAPTRDNIAHTGADLAYTEDNLTRTGDDIARTRDDIARTGADIARTGADLTQTGDNTTQTGDDLAQTGDDLAQTGNDLIRTGDDLVRTGDDLARTGVALARTGDDIERTGDDIERTGDDKDSPETGISPRKTENSLKTEANSEKNYDKIKTSAQSALRTTGKIIDLNSIMQNIYNKTAKHNERIIDGKPQTSFYTYEREKGRLIERELEHTYLLPGFDIKASKYIMFSIFLSLRREFGSKYKQNLIPLKMARLLMFMYDKKKFTYYSFKQSYKCCRTTFYTMLDLIIEKQWIEPYSLRKTDAYYISEKGKEYVESILAAIPD